MRKVKDGPTTDDLYAFLTTDANTEVKAIHPMAMPVFIANWCGNHYDIAGYIYDVNGQAADDITPAIVAVITRQ